MYEEKKLFFKEKKATMNFETNLHKNVWKQRFYWYIGWLSEHLWNLYETYQL